MSKTATAIETLPSPAELAKIGFEAVASKPTIFKLRELPVNGVIDGVLKDIRPSTNPEQIRQPLLTMELTKDKILEHSEMYLPLVFILLITLQLVKVERF